MLPPVFAQLGEGLLLIRWGFETHIERTIAEVFTACTASGAGIERGLAVAGGDGNSG